MMLFRKTLCVALAVGVMAVATSAQAGELTDKLVGTWIPDVEKTVEMLKKSGDFDDDEIEEIKAELGGGIELTIKKENKFSIKVPDAGQELEGSWEVAEEEMNGKVTLKMILKFGDVEQPMNFTFENMEGDYVKAAPEDQPPAVFKKKTD